MIGTFLDCGLIENKPLRLVPTGPDHLANCINWLADPEINKYLITRFAITIDQEQSWFATKSKDPDSVIWSIELAGEHVGQTGIENINRIDRTGITGIFIGKQWWRKGIATAVMRARAKYAFEELNFTALYTEVYQENEGSKKAAMKIGYKQYGVRPYAKYCQGRYLEAWLGYLDRENWLANQDKV